MIIHTIRVFCTSAMGILSSIWFFLLNAFALMIELAYYVCNYGQNKANHVFLNSENYSREFYKQVRPKMHLMLNFCVLIINVVKPIWSHFIDIKY